MMFSTFWSCSLHDRSPEVGFCPPREERTPVNFSHKDLSKVGASLHFVRCEYHELLWNLLLFETTLSRWTTHNPISSWLRHNNTVQEFRQVSPLVRYFKKSSDSSASVLGTCYDSGNDAVPVCWPLCRLLLLETVGKISDMSRYQSSDFNRVCTSVL